MQGTLKIRIKTKTESAYFRAYSRRIWLKESRRYSFLQRFLRKHRISGSKLAFPNISKSEKEQISTLKAKLTI
jgi:hypothetical protein